MRRHIIDIKKRQEGKACTRITMKEKTCVIGIRKLTLKDHQTSWRTGHRRHTIRKIIQIPKEITEVIPKWMILVRCHRRTNKEEAIGTCAPVDTGMACAL
jgi:hypothetical protein